MFITEVSVINTCDNLSTLSDNVNFYPAMPYFTLVCINLPMTLPSYDALYPCVTLPRAQQAEPRSLSILKKIKNAWSLSLLPFSSLLLLFSSLHSPSSLLGEFDAGGGGCAAPPLLSCHDGFMRKVVAFLASERMR